MYREPQAIATTAFQEVTVRSGANDERSAGYSRLLDGGRKVLWEHDTAHEFQTGGIEGPGAVAVP
jgi:hypothetical protein